MTSLLTAAVFLAGAAVGWAASQRAADEALRRAQVARRRQVAAVRVDDSGEPLWFNADTGTWDPMPDIDPDMFRYLREDDDE